MRKKPAKIRLIDDSAFLLQRAKPHEEKPEFMFRSEKHREWIRTKPCILCGRLGCEAAHLRFDTQTGKSVTPHDFWCWPGDVACHENLQHLVGEKTFWHNRLGIADPHRFILNVYALPSPCVRTRIAAQAEYERRYGA